MKYLMLVLAVIVIRLAPNWYKGHLLPSQILRNMGRHDDAELEAALAASLGWRKQS